MSRKGENIYKRKDGRWEGRYIKARTPQGKAVYGSVYAYTYNEVRKKKKPGSGRPCYRSFGAGYSSSAAPVLCQGFRRLAGIHTAKSQRIFLYEVY